MLGVPWMAVAGVVGLVCLAAVASHLAWAVWAGKRAAPVPAGAWLAAVLLATAALSSQGHSGELALAVGVALGRVAPALARLRLGKVELSPGGGSGPSWSVQSVARRYRKSSSRTWP